MVDLDVFHINEGMVDVAFKKLKMSYRPGPDGIPSCIFKKCSTSLIAPLVAIFNKSMHLQQFPTAWKTSHMLPVFKKGDKTDIVNYRGITSLSAGSKCLEIIVNNVMFSSCCSYLSEKQHGFYPKRSVESNLCDFTSTCICAMDNGVQVDAVYTDTSRLLLTPLTTISFWQNYFGLVYQQECVNGSNRISAIEIFA